MHSRRKNFAKGTFYPSNPEELKNIFKRALEEEDISYNLGDKKIIGGIAPHAGYTYCAKVGVHLFETLRKSGDKWDTVIIINPNHTGYGNSIEGDDYDYWKSPLGEVELDKELLEKLELDTGELAQKFEHSAEVMVPYLKHFLKGEFKILPICMMDHTYKGARRLAEKIFQTTHNEKRVLLLVSSDFNHFKTREEGIELDDYALDSIMKLDSVEFRNRVIEKEISICGLGPVMVLMEYIKLVSKNPDMQILARGDSGEINNQNHVVDYISLIAIDNK